MGRLRVGPKSLYQTNTDQANEASVVYSLELQGADGGSNEERKIESTWTVYIPKEKFALIVANRFGGVYIKDNAYKSISAHVKFGVLLCGSLQTDEQKCELKVEHGSLTLTDCKTANVLRQPGAQRTASRAGEHRHLHRPQPQERILRRHP